MILCSHFSTLSQLGNKCWITVESVVDVRAATTLMFAGALII